MKKFSMKHIIAFAACAVLACSAIAVAACSPAESAHVEGSAGLTYVLNEDGKGYTFTSLGTCTDKNVVIGNWHEGLPVTAVGEGACRDDEEAGTFNVVVESITLSAGVSDIGFRGLQNWNVKKVILPDGLETIGKAALRKNTSMTVVVIGKGLKTIGQDAFSLIEASQNVRIYFRGSETEWNAVTVEAGNEVLSNFTVTYNYAGDGSEL